MGQEWRLLHEKPQMMRRDCKMADKSNIDRRAFVVGALGAGIMALSGCSSGTAANGRSKTDTAFGNAGSAEKNSQEQPVPGNAGDAKMRPIVYFTKDIAPNGLMKAWAPLALPRLRASCSSITRAHFRRPGRVHPRTPFWNPWPRLPLPLQTTWMGTWRMST